MTSKSLGVLAPKSAGFADYVKVLDSCLADPHTVTLSSPPFLEVETGFTVLPACYTSEKKRIEHGIASPPKKEPPKKGQLRALTEKKRIVQ